MGEFYGMDLYLHKDVSIKKRIHSYVLLFWCLELNFEKNSLYFLKQ